ncbi:DUF5776 domain-containing protein [Lentilactobacillus hilgardii]|nr:DUF5776 domain-containing protein [Lentilactobacillus hilgardii]MCV3741338.1 DUF5776 domain-containing protein [Lentilactobacillus hilgardii]
MLKHEYLMSILKIMFTFAVTLVGCTISTQASERPSTIGPVTVYQSPTPTSGHLLNNRDYGARSPRVIQLEHQANPADNGKLLLTFEQVPEVGKTPVFPIYESDNNGSSWRLVGNVHETKEIDWGMTNCPQLYELPERIGNMPKGTIVLAGDATPNDLSDTELQMVTSNDLGKTWSYKSTIATGGANPSNFTGKDPIWEPFLMVHNNKLLVYYSDERDNSISAGSQTIVHEASNDGINWSSPVVDVDYNKNNDTNAPQRPGMPVIAQLPNGNFAMSYEHVQHGKSDISEVRIASDPEKFSDSSAIQLVTSGGGNPYIVTLNNGKIAFNYGGSSKVYVFDNQADIEKGLSAAKVYATKSGSSYNRQLLPLNNGMLLIATGDGSEFPKFAPIRIETIDVGDKAVASSGDSGTTTPTTPVQPSISTSSSSSSAQSSSSNTPTSSTSTVSSSSSSTAPSTSVAKQVESFKIVAVKALYRYNSVNFSKANRIKYYAKKSITKAPVFTVVATTKSSNGALRYQLSDGSYITTKAGYVTKLYNQAKVKTLRVINPKGTWEYRSSKLTKKSAVKHLKQNKVVKVKKLIRKGTATRYQLTNGHYVTGNKQFVKAIK